MTWSGHYAPGIVGWREALDEAISADDVERTPHRLAEICLTVSKTLTMPTHRTRSGLPKNLPDKTTTQAAAESLLDWADRQPDRPEAPAWKVIGLLHRLHLQRLVDQEIEGSILADHNEALQISQTLDSDTQLLCLLTLSKTYRDNNDDASALATATTAQTILEKLEPGSPEPPPTWAAATGHAPWLPSQADTRLLFEHRAHVRARIGAYGLRDYDRATLEGDLAISTAERIKDKWQVLYAAALANRANIARNLGDVSTALDLLDKQGQYAAETPALAVQRQRLQSLHFSAQFFDDWTAARAYRLDLVRLRLSEIPSDSDPSPENASCAVDVYRDAGRRAQVTNLGNDAYDLAFNLIESGRAMLNSTARAEARAWLAVAEKAWSDIAGNGRIAIDHRLLMLDAMDNLAGDPLEVGRRMVDFSRDWRRVAGRRRSALAAVEWGAAGDHVVLDRLLELRADAPPVDAAYLDLGIANWHLKTGNHQQSQGETLAAVESWRSAARLAAAATAGLAVDRPTGPPILLNAQNYIESLQVRADALRRLRDTGHPEGATEHDELAVRVASLPAIAQRLTASASPLQRATIDRLYSAWLSDTANLAVQLNDYNTADEVMEVARRDLVGTVLYALSTQPDTPEQIADLARHLIANLNAKITDPDAAESDPPDITTDPDTGVRGARVMDQLTSTLDVVGEVLGPVAKTLFDPRTVLDSTGNAALEALQTDDTAGAVLSLWLQPGGDKPRVLRRLTWRSTPGEETQEYLDTVTAPSWLPSYDIGDDPALFFARLDTLTRHLLPAPLIELLQAADPDHPINLVVIPTGLLVVPFAALPITSDYRLIDLAVVSTAQSLRAITTLVAGRSPTDDLVESFDIGIYDTIHLIHTQAEWNELHKHRPGVRPISTLKEADDAFADPARRGRIGVFALAVHGQQGTDGWSQIKQLPSGENLTTGHVLQWYIPRLVVGASCNTDIRTDAGGELGGFPLAFQLRGATTIIGSLHYIDDQATGQIMGLFYAASAAGLSPAAALRQAQRTWIAANRTTRLPALEHWAYLLTYGLPS